MIASQIESYTLISLGSLRTGVALHAPIYDASSNPPLLLLANGTMLTESLLALLHKRGIQEVRVCISEMARLLNLGTSSVPKPTNKIGSLQAPTKQPKKTAYNSAKKELGSKPFTATHSSNKHAQNQLIKLKSNSFYHQLQDHTTDKIDSVKVLASKEKRALAGVKIDAVYKEFAEGKVKSTRALETMSSESLLEIAEDMDIFLTIGLNPKEKSYPSRHSLQMASMAMAIGTIHGLNKDELIELGIGCLIHDAGMLLLEDKSFATAQEFGMKEHLSITKHPILTQEILQSCNDIPKPSLLVSYQIHERCDGSGYPRGRQGSQIHYLAKIGMVADVYVALTSERSYRPAYHPYHAMEQILHQTNHGKFDPLVVRSLLRTISLFPINSYVQLSDNSPARVVRANRMEFMKPVVEIWDWNNLGGNTQRVNLQEEKNLVIVRPLEEFPLKSAIMG